MVSPMKEERKLKMEGGLLKTAYTLQMNRNPGGEKYLVYEQHRV